MAGTRIGVAGDLVFANAVAALAALRDALARAHGTTLQLDLAAVGRADSAGLACILALLAEAHRRGQGMVLEHVPEALRALAEACEITPLLVPPADAST